MLHGPAMFHSDRGLRISGAFWSGVEDDQGAAFTRTTKSGLRFAGFYRDRQKNGP